MNIHIFEKQYNPISYHCVHFVIDAAKYFLDKDYSSSFIGLTESLDQSISASREIIIKNKRIDVPLEGCIVLMTGNGGENHVGLFHDGKVIHLNDSGVHYVNIRSLRFNYMRFRFYEPVNDI